ncbi:hypothetical protein AMECASPLE_019870 [Ameca splendens]|uniref:Uncharacterized protein n=1 Tax=Ameca splendens TaxID=208324 RepID=A0ABV1A0U6_9TELE
MSFEVSDSDFECVSEILSDSGTEDAEDDLDDAVDKNMLRKMKVFHLTELKNRRKQNVQMLRKNLFSCALQN